MKAAIALISVLIWAVPAYAERRFALVIGANQGHANDVPLRHAERDATRVAETLELVGGFQSQDISILAAPSANAVRGAFSAIEQKMGKSSQGLLFVFYSGHADSEALRLGSDALPYDDFLALLKESPARVKVAVLDACRAGQITRSKGGQVERGALRVPSIPSTVQGLAILASSSATEDAQESDDLNGSFFTHYFVSALLGAADQDTDGQITLGEAFSYASSRTLAATKTTFVGPQHPSFRFELQGQSDLVLALPGHLNQRVGQLAFASPGTYIIEGEKRVVAEVESEASGHPLTLPVGDYRVVRRTKGSISEGQFAVSAGARTQVGTSDLSELKHARVTRKGGLDAPTTWSMFVSGSGRSPLLNTGSAWLASVGARWDLSYLSLEGRFFGGLADQQNQQLSIQTREIGISVAALRALDIGPVVLSGGGEAGLLHLAQAFDVDTTDNRDSLGFSVGPVLTLEVPFQTFYVRADAGLPGYWVRLEESESAHFEFLFRAGVGFGLYL